MNGYMKKTQKASKAVTKKALKIKKEYFDGKEK